MSLFRLDHFFLYLFLGCMASVVSYAAENATTNEPPPPSSDPVAPVPRDRDYDWMSLAQWQKEHAENVTIAAKGEAELVFIGDSITASTRGSESWKKTFAIFRTANFGIGGDRTQNILWRLEQGEIGTLKPKLVVLLIGTNNIGTTENDVADTVCGVTAVVGKLRSAFPAAKVLVLGVFPRDEDPASPVRAKVQLINSALAKLDDGKAIFVHDIGKVFLEADGTLSTAVSQDHLHLTEEGLRRWAEALAPIVRQLMR
ncbi:MAG: mucin-desulfating sulfatase [Verrucomicrobia bacterium]|nr:mucin-desulfating sulfatase [Verrucomicrobiota bacterium]